MGGPPHSFIELSCLTADSQEICPSVHCFPLVPWRIIESTLVLGLSADSAR